MGSLNMHQQTAVAYGLWLNGLQGAQETVGKGALPSDLPSLRDLTLSWLRFGYQGKVIESESINSILDQALEEGYQACFIQVPGNIISEDWMLPHWQQADFHRCVETHLQKDDFLICANFTEAGNYFALDTSCFLVNLCRYKEMGCPQFGDALETLSNTNKNRLKLIKPQKKTSIVSGQNSTHIEASQVEESKSLISTKPSHSGWGFIEASLQSGLSIPQLPEKIANKRLLLEPSPQKISAEVSDSAKTASLSEPIKKHFLDGIDTQINRGRMGVFLWNIESYDDLPNKNIGTISNADTTDKISNLYCVAAGFKPNMLLQTHGFDRDTCVTFFDYSQQALNIRKTLLDEWDGVDYPDFCRSLIQRYPECETFYQLWNGIGASEINWDDAYQLWEDELKKWGGAEKFQSAWNAQRALKFNFVHGDFINNPEPLLSQVSNSNGSVIWWSNAFFTISSNWLMTIKQRQKCFQNWINNLATQAPKCSIYGADYNNTPINSISAEDYAAQLNTRFLQNTKDELTPVLSARPLRF